MAKQIPFLLCSGLLLAACQTNNSYSSLIAPPVEGDGGVVVAESMMLGQGGAIGKGGESSDCSYEGGLGITVQTSLEQQDYVYDAHGEPCQRAETIFDGRLVGGKAQRAASTDVKIDFLDRHGPLGVLANTPAANNIDTRESDLMYADEFAGRVPPAPVLSETATDMPADVVAMAATQQPADPIKTTLSQWQKDEQERVRRMVEREMATRRETSRIAKDYTEDFQTKEALALASRLREAERQAELQQQKYDEAMKRMEEMRTRLEQGQVTSSRNEREMREQLDRLQVQNKDLMQRATRADKEQQLIQQEYEQKLAGLKNNLNVAESVAATARQAAVLQAAQQIAEAEKLAYAARVAERQALEREAARLQEKADELAAKARSMPNTYDAPDDAGLKDAYAQLTRREELFRQKLARIPGEPVAGGDALSQIQLILNEKDKPLKDIFDQIFADVAPQIGQWKLQWELSTPNAPLADEAWTVTAETNFDDFLAYVTRKVREAHNVDLKFQRFDQNKVVVISD